METLVKNLGHFFLTLKLHFGLCDLLECDRYMHYTITIQSYIDILSHHLHRAGRLMHCGTKFSSS